MLRLLALVLLPATLVGQQAQCPRPASDTAALELAAVAHRPIADSGNAPPLYPQLLQQARVGGPVRVLFTVDTAGLPEPTSIRVARSPNPGFDSFVKRAVARWRFTPASHCARRVRVSLAYEFLFRTTPPDTARLARLFEFDTTVTLVRDTLPDGTPRTTLEARRSPPVVADLPWDPLAGDSAEETVLASLVDGLSAWKDSLPRIVCVAGRTQDVDPDDGRLFRLNQIGAVTVLPSRRCPPTFSSMMRFPGQRPAPPGEDPFHIRVKTRKRISVARFLFDVDVEHGTGGTRYQCGAERRTTGWRSQCIPVSSWAS
jgi:TonB family protein